MSEPWNITENTISHTQAPYFKARWQTGRSGLEELEGLFWYNEASGEDEDTVVIFGFEWESHPPAQSAFEPLMESAAKALEKWIMSRM